MNSYIPIVVTYNRKEKLNKALNRLLNQTIEPEKIIVIDNHSNDGTKQLVLNNYKTEISKKYIEYYYLNENIGGSGGFYKGVKIAQNYNVDYIALADDDAFYENDYFEKIFDIANKYPDIKAFQGFAFDKKTNKYNIQGKKIINWNTLQTKEISNSNQNEIADIATFVGFTFKKELLNEVGLPVSNFFIWNDDTEYSLRINPYTKILQVKNAIVEHRGTQRKEGSLVPLWKTYYGFRNAFVLRKKYSKNKFIGYLYTTFLLFRHTFAIFIKRNYRKHRLLYLQAYWDAYWDAVFDNLGKNKKFLPSKNSN